ncbi:MAG: hypothetical protein HN353_00440 [Bdellovibrionales bacterium]|jgi:hypothetical protein|nr:hypothetical protein [Bdellovibrionales bacterium]MBT3525673.1 hypothetical protein [Bdellovibrionales bacterium]MBT7768111.1 hypothetical protein [Bdellovibrionales bacterium]
MKIAIDNGLCTAPEADKCRIFTNNDSGRYYVENSQRDDITLASFTFDEILMKLQMSKASGICK